jgi:hypothetical protein
MWIDGSNLICVLLLCEDAAGVDSSLDTRKEDEDFTEC